MWGSGRTLGPLWSERSEGPFRPSGPPRGEGFPVWSTGDSRSQRCQREVGRKRSFRLPRDVLTFSLTTTDMSMWGEVPRVG